MRRDGRKSADFLTRHRLLGVTACIVDVLCTHTFCTNRSREGWAVTIQRWHRKVAAGETCTAEEASEVVVIIRFDCNQSGCNCLLLNIERGVPREIGGAWCLCGLWKAARRTVLLG